MEIIEKYITETIDAQLEAVAKSNGYLTWAEMQAAADADDIADREELAGKLIPGFAQALGVLPERTGLADGKVDLVGLPHDPDAAKNFARMIRVLLLGYKTEEVEYLIERALDMDAKEQEAAARMDVLMAGLELPTQKYGSQP